MFISKIVLIIFMTLIASTGFTEQRQPQIVVVGAGLAGLTTAYRLQQKGMVCQVYEARNRVGGRVFTAKIGNDVVELGGQNITDGGNAENLRRLINEFQLELAEHRVNLDYHYFDGEKFLPAYLINKDKFDPETLRSQLAAAAQKADHMRDVLDEILSAEDPLYKTLCVRLAAYEGAPVEKLSPLYIETLYHMILGGICAAHQASVDEKSYVDIVTIKGGNALLLEKLAQSLKNRVHLNMPLVRVAETSEHTYELCFQNGHKIKADILVLAIPCSVYEDIVFEEAIIPAERLRSIKKVQYGTNAKILIPFSSRPSKTTTFINERIGCYFGDSQILTLYFTGESGRFSPSSILQAYEQERPMLEKGFGNLCPSLAAPAFALDESSVSYEGPVGYSWPNDPYAKGTYSYIAAGQEDSLTAIHDEGAEKVRSLFAPIDHRLYFAGEHTSILMQVPGTMESAAESGERVARMIESASCPSQS